MRTITKVVMAGVLVASSMTPVLASAASLTAEQINSVIGLLESFNVEAKTVETVKAVLNNTTPPSTQPSTIAGPSVPPGQVGKMMCVRLLRNLTIGSRGDDVRELQKMLAEDPSTGFVGTTTGFYGPMTAKAMMRYQQANGIASTTTGTVGPMTRGFFERRCGLGLSKVTPPGPYASGTPIVAP